MDLTNFPNGISSFGMPLVGSGGHTTTGNVFFVDSGAGTDAPGNGDSPDNPFASIDYAVGRCTANNGVFIYVMPGHAESVTAAGGLDLDVAGISIIGIGRGSDRPTVTFSSSTSADMDVDAANVYVENILFVAGIDALVAPIDVNAADCTFVNIETRDVAGSYQTVDYILTDANADRLRINGWVHRGDTAAGSASAISIVGGDNIEIDNFDISGNFSAAAIENVTTATVNARIGAKSQGNVVRNYNSADVLATMVATSTGFINNILGRLADDAANITEAFVGADMQFGPELYIANADGERAIQWNGTASADA